MADLYEVTGFANLFDFTQILGGTGRTKAYSVVFAFSYKLYCVVELTIDTPTLVS